MSYSTYCTTTSPMTRMCLISVSWVAIGVDEMGLACSPERVRSLGLRSAHWNIFMALRELVDHRRITPSRDPDAKKLARKKQKINFGLHCGKCWLIFWSELASTPISLGLRVTTSSCHDSSHYIMISLVETRSV